MNNMNKPVKVHRLPTKDNTALITIGYHNDKLNFKNPYANIINSKYQHLYFTSDEEPKDGDWFIRNIGSILAVEQYIKDDHLYAKDRKIVATTDKSLHGTFNENIKSAVYSDRYKLPQIPQSFIEEYVKADGKIDEVLVEYTKDICTHNSCYTPKCDDICYSIKTDSNNCVITNPVEPKLYTLEEVKIIAKNAFMEGGKSGYNSSKGLDFQTSDNWIKENL